MFHSFPVAANAAIFGLAALAVWFAGTRLVRYADAFAERTGASRELLGILLLGGVTSLPEIAVAVTATLQGTPALSINDVLGSAGINVLILALADAVIGRRALTSVVASPVVMLQGVLGIVLMAIAAAAVLTGDRVIFGVGVWCWIMLAAYLLGIALLAGTHAGSAWQATGRQQAGEEARDDKPGAPGPLAWRTAAVAAVIFIAGFLLARSGEALAGQTGLGTSFFGAAFLALSTSLPEVSTVVAAVRMRQYAMAVSDVFGTNLFNMTIIVLVDALHPGGPVLVEAGRFAAFAALLALVLTAIYLAGMIERRDRTVLRMGVDSLAAIVVYVAGVVLLYQLR